MSPWSILSTNTDDCMENHLNIINTSTWTVHLEKRGETSASHWGSKYVGPHIQIAEHVPNSTFNNKPPNMTKFPTFLHQPLSIPPAFIECNQAFRGTGPHLLRARDPLDFRRPGKSEVTQTYKCVECLKNMVGHGMAWNFTGVERTRWLSHGRKFKPRRLFASID